MKLIDIENCEFQRYEPQNDLAYALGWNDCVDCIEEELSNETPVEAIPIDWLISRCVRAYDENDTVMRDCIGVLIDEWQEEQEEENEAN